jgi:hypothetical protein
MINLPHSRFDVNGEFRDEIDDEQGKENDGDIP